MNELWRDFSAFLENADDGDLTLARDKAEAMLDEYTDQEVASSIRRMIRRIEEEMVNRSSLAKLIRRRP